MIFVALQSLKTLNSLTPSISLCEFIGHAFSLFRPTVEIIRSPRTTWKHFCYSFHQSWIPADMAQNPLDILKENYLEFGEMLSGSNIEILYLEFWEMLSGSNIQILAHLPFQDIILWLLVVIAASASVSHCYLNELIICFSGFGLTCRLNNIKYFIFMFEACHAAE